MVLFVTKNNPWGSTHEEANNECIITPVNSRIFEAFYQYKRFHFSNAKGRGKFQGVNVVFLLLFFRFLRLATNILSIVTIVRPLIYLNFES